MTAITITHRAYTFVSKDSAWQSFPKGEITLMDLSVQEQEELKAHLMAADENFRQLAEEHARLKKRVAEIEANPHPSEEEIIEEARLKKRKLALKDQMLEMMHQYRETHAA
jgi:uncharacterized protein YdcH (DUF465 family)